jgi:hypothetical protein
VVANRAIVCRRPDIEPLHRSISPWLVDRNRRPGCHRRATTTPLAPPFRRSSQTTSKIFSFRYLLAAYIEALGKDFEKPTVKQHLAAIRMLFDWLVTSQVVATNPAHAVREDAMVVSNI